MVYVIIQYMLYPNPALYIPSLHVECVSPSDSLCVHHVDTNILFVAYMYKLKRTSVLSSSYGTADSVCIAATVAIIYVHNKINIVHNILSDLRAAYSHI